jgi:hypothetical protein
MACRTRRNEAEPSTLGGAPTDPWNSEPPTRFAARRSALELNALALCFELGRKMQERNQCVLAGEMIHVPAIDVKPNRRVCPASFNAAGLRDGPNTSSNGLPPTTVLTAVSKNSARTPSRRAGSGETIALGTLSSILKQAQIKSKEACKIRYANTWKPNLSSISRNTQWPAGAALCFELGRKIQSGINGSIAIAITQ